MHREYEVVECFNCKKAKPVAAQGLCRTCYQRWRRYGSFEPRVRERSICAVEECDRFVVSHGFCEKHWDRVATTGDPNKTLRPEDWGKRRKHPLYHSWRNARAEIGVVKQWEDFWKFVHDVGDVRPSGVHRLIRVKETALIGPSNFKWAMPIVSGEKGAAYARVHRKANPDYWKNSELKKHFGITLGQYLSLIHI